MNTPTRSYVDTLHMAQRGLLFKREPQAVVRELPRATGLRDIKPGDILRGRMHPERLFTVLEHRPCCLRCGGVVALNESGRLVEITGRQVMRDLEHADGAGICVGVQP